MGDSASAIEVAEAAALESSTVPLQITLKMPSFKMPRLGPGGPTANKQCTVEAQLPDGSLVKRVLRTDESGRASTMIPRAVVLDVDAPGAVLLSNSLWGKPPYRFKLPAGDYDVRFRGVPIPTSHMTMPPPDSSYVTRRVRIAEEETLSESFTLRGGGTLEVSVECETPSASPPSTYPRSTEGLYESGWDALQLSKEIDGVESPRCVATLALIHPAGSGRPTASPPAASRFTHA